MWLKVLTVYKRHDKYDIFSKWSAKSENYSEYRNRYFYDRITSYIDINFLINELRRHKVDIKYIERYKYVDHITTDLTGLKKIEFNNRYVYNTTASDTLDYDIFDKYKTLIIKSCTGTGKTTAVAKHFAKLKSHNPELKLISITNKITLADQHIATFASENITLTNYRDVKTKDHNKQVDLAICLNSLFKFLDDLDFDEETDYVLYIDEITSFLSFTHNDTLNNNLQKICKKK